jgi:hypothetical protein
MRKPGCQGVMMTSRVASMVARFFFEGGLNEKE